MARVITFGEIMLRLSPVGNYRFVQADSFDAVYGGGEANVAVALSNFGVDCAHVTALPDNDIGQAAVNWLRRYGVDTQYVNRSGDRIGIYYLEKGASQRLSKVIYDRAGSSIAAASRADFDWDKIFDGAEWLHFTGITPALSDELAAVCEDACKAAKERNMIVSCDPNYRAKLWTKEKARTVMTQLMPYVDVCITNEGQAKDVFGIESGVDAGENPEFNRDSVAECAKILSDTFGFRTVAMTQRKSISSSDNDIAAMLYSGGKSYFSKQYRCHIVDRIGGGDAFAAGLIYSLMNNDDMQTAVEFAVASNCIKHTIEGDSNIATVDEVSTIAASDGHFMVSR